MWYDMYIGIHVKYPLLFSDFNLSKPKAYIIYHQL